MAEEYLAEPDEADQAADYYMKQFASEGAAIGQPIELVVDVSKIPPEKLSDIERRVRELYQCTRVEHGKAGFFKKPSLRAFLQPMPFDRANMLSSASSLYRLILDEDVTVSIEKA
ncbi:hypothetical protein ACFPOA_01365 [Lysobacter niabensis]|uniref:hypothetical protein n=1 Tax=Agrilutibacter niabensis TaxID=380628 RepID=UPI00360F696D